MISFLIRFTPSAQSYTKIDNYNLRYFDNGDIGISLDETSTDEDLFEIAKHFNSKIQNETGFELKGSHL